MYELRILNGLHRGATLPLDTHAITIGTGEDADVVMADHGIAAEHAVLSRAGQGWLLSAAGGQIYAADQRQPQTVLELGAGDLARIGDIWLMIALESARWETPPALPEPEPDFDPRAMAAEAEAEAARALPAAPPPAAGKAAGRRAPRRRLGIALFTLTMLGGATAYALTSRPAPPERTFAPAKPDPLRAAAPEAAGKPAESLALKAPDAAELAKLFRKRLEDAELLNRFDLKLDPNSWSMQAQLDDDETARFERILTSFIKEHHITFPVSAKAVTAEAMLPFKIGQVISSANPSMVTQDGARLYVGDEYRGVRVVAIQKNRLTFFGKRKIEVDW
ncbi:type III secretion protein D [Oxalobacteraceae bacterium GrIS 1.11]